MEKDIANMDPKKLPDVVAFQDEYTRGFMASTEEVDEGYYLFESKTGGYTMWYPEDGKMDNLFYKHSKDTYESIQITGETDEEPSAHYFMRIVYNYLDSTENVERYLDLLSNTLNYEGSYEEIEFDHTSLYYANDFITYEQIDTYRFFALVVSKSNKQVVRYSLNIKCKDKSKDCSLDTKLIEEEAKKVMRSIEFSDDSN